MDNEPDESVVSLCRQLLLGESITSHHYPNDPVPPDAALTYGKWIAAEDIGAHCDCSFAQAALIRIALSDQEDDRVRIEAIQQLLNNNSSHLEVTLLGLVFDRDSELRQAVLEGLALISSPYLTFAARLLSKDDDEFVAASANEILAGGEAKLFRLSREP